VGTDFSRQGLADSHDLVDALEDVPTPRYPVAPWWFWTLVLVAVSASCAMLWLSGMDDGLQAGIAPYTFVGNSLALIPYDWFLPAYVQHHVPWIGVALATGATVLVEFWNMDVLARILSRDGTRAFRQHRITSRFLHWYRKAPWWTMVAAGALPVVPFYPCRFLATLARYPMWRYQASVIVGRTVRYAGLAGLGVLLPIPPTFYFLIGVGFLAALGLKHLQSRLRRPARVT
jgi:membrane protein YqaA with SNARE-associated domain